MGGASVKKGKKAWYYTADEVYPLIGWHPQYIRMCARDCPEKLPFPTIRNNTHTYIPKKPFDDWYESVSGERLSNDEG